MDDRHAARPSLLDLLVSSLALWTAVWAAFLALTSPVALHHLVGAWRPVVLAGLVVAVALCGRLFRRVARGSVPSSPGRGVRLWVVSMVGAGSACVALSEPFSDLAAAVLLGLGAGCFALLRSLPAPARLRRIRGALDVLVFNLCLLVIGAELGLRALSRVRPSVLFERHDEVSADKIERTRLPPGTLRYGFPTDSRGYYDDELSTNEAGRPLVLSIADSFAVGPVPHYYHFTTVIERELPSTRVYNMGVSAIGPREYLQLLLEEGLALRPNLVLVHLFVGNDLALPPRAVHEPGLLRSFLDRRNLLVLLVPERLRALAREGRVGGQKVDFDRDRYRETPVRSVETLHAIYPWLLDPELEPPSMSRGAFLEIETSRARRLARASVAEYEEGLEPLLHMREALGKTPMVVALMPACYQIEDEVWQAIGGNGELGRDRPQSVVNRWLARQGIPAVDLLPVFRAAPPLADGDRHLYAKYDTHTNRWGNEVAGRAIAELLRTRLP